MLFLTPVSTYAVIETYEFENPEQEQRYHEFIEVLRCPKCQNQNLAGSNSPIAEDLRRELAKQLKSGKSDKEIIDFMVARFGDFVLYDPPLKKSTWLLWFGPALLLLCGLMLLAYLIRSSGAGQVGVQTGLEEGESEPVAGGFVSDAGKRGPRLVLLGLLLLSIAIAAVLYQQLGASRQLEIAQLSNTFYLDVGEAQKEGRLPDKNKGQALIDSLLQQLEKSPEDLSSRYLLGSTYAFLADYDQAIPHYKTYLMAVPTDERVLTEYVQLLYIAAGQQLTERVQFVVDRALSLNPHNRDILSLLAMHYFEKGDYAKAATHWEQLLSMLGPSDPDFKLIQRAYLTSKQASSESAETEKQGAGTAP